MNSDCVRARGGRGEEPDEMRSIDHREPAWKKSSPLELQRFLRDRHGGHRPSNASHLATEQGEKKKIPLRLKGTLKAEKRGAGGTV